MCFFSNKRILILIIYNNIDNIIYNILQSTSSCTLKERNINAQLHYIALHCITLHYIITIAIAIIVVVVIIIIIIIFIIITIIITLKRRIHVIIVVFRGRFYELLMFHCYKSVKLYTDIQPNSIQKPRHVNPSPDRFSCYVPELKATHVDIHAQCMQRYTIYICVGMCVLKEVYTA